MGGDGEERSREHGQCDVPVPGVVAANLVVVQAGLVLGELKCFLDTPTTPGDPDELSQRHGVAGVTDVVGQLVGFADRAADQQQVFIGAGIVLLAAVFWWNMKRRAREEDEDES